MRSRRSLKGMSRSSSQRVVDYLAFTTECTSSRQSILHPNNRINANSASLCNYEVMQILQTLKDETLRKHKRDGALATVTYETLKYLQNTECNYQSEDILNNLLTELQSFNLTKAEKLMILNTPPRSPLEVQLVVQDSQAKLSDDQVDLLIALINEILPLPVES